MKKFLVSLITALALLSALTANAVPVYFASISVAGGSIVAEQGPLNDPLQTFVSSEVECPTPDYCTYTYTIEFPSEAGGQNRLTNAATAPPFTLTRVVIGIGPLVQPEDILNITPYGEVGTWSNLAGDIEGVSFDLSTSVSGTVLRMTGGKPTWGSVAFEGQDSENDLYGAINASFNQISDLPFDGPQPFGLILVPGETPIPLVENQVPEPATWAILIPSLFFLSATSMLGRRKAAKQLA